MRTALLLVVALALSAACSFVPPEPSVEITAVSFDWSNPIWENVKFTVQNTGNVALSGISIYYTAECAGGSFDHIATYPSIYFDTNTPVAPGAICYAGTALATLTGGANRIVVKQVTLEYGFNSAATVGDSTVFVKP